MVRFGSFARMESLRLSVSVGSLDGWTSTELVPAGKCRLGRTLGMQGIIDSIPHLQFTLASVKKEGSGFMYILG